MRNVLAFMGTAVPALILATSPAGAEGKADRARQAIAEAQGKVQTLGSLGAAGDTPRLVAQAQAALRSAQDNLKGGHKETAIDDAHRASELADTAINLSRQTQVQAQSAQAEADAANARAAGAERAAAAARADAAAARAAPPVVVAAPAPETTVTTETTRTAAASTRTAPRRTTTRVVKRKPATRTAARPTTVTEKTTTTVSSN